uniref:Uncharacterized protein n=1 Tax=Tetranychus urticae TaxID=32264 RepID=A0A158P4V0_TETUR
MFIHLLIWIFQFCLLTPKAYSFKTPKHDSSFYYKTHDSVFLTNPHHHTTSYGIYVAGQTITIDIPTSVVSVSEILDWKVVNTNKKRLLFVHNNKPKILIDQQRIKEIEYSGKLSDSIIAFGDNEALHVPTIKNPGLTKPAVDWNYLELLHFDDENEKVSVKRSLPWLKDDYKFIIEWKMTDYVHFDNKLYLLIYRSIWNEKYANFTQEISIIQLCLDQGSELISSAVEIHFTQPELQTNLISDLIFVFIFGPWDNETSRYQLHTIQLGPTSDFEMYHIYHFSDIVSLFEQTANESSTCSHNITLLRYHLRSEVGECKKSYNKSCSTRENIVPSRNVSPILNIMFPIYQQFVFRKFYFITLPYPHFKRLLLIHPNPIMYSAICDYHPEQQCLNLTTINSNLLTKSSEVNVHINKSPFGFFYVDTSDNENLFLPIEVCSNLKTCAQCIMYGLYYNCIWSNFICVHDTQPKNKVALTVDYCFKIINISPLIFNSSLPTKLTIQLDRPLIKDDQEQLVIQAGDNHCTNITTNEVFINCSMNATKSGQFKIDVSLRSDRYADASIISAVSIDKVNISEPDVIIVNVLPPENQHPTISGGNTFTIIIILLFGLLIGAFVFIIYTNHDKNLKMNLNKFLKFARSTAIMQIAAKTMKSKKVSLQMKSLFSKKSTSEIAVTKEMKIDTKTKESKKVSLTKENLPSMKKLTSKSTVISQKKMQAKTMKAKNVSLKMKRLPSKKKLTSKSAVTKQSKVASKSMKSKKPSLSMKSPPSKKKLTSKSNVTKEMKIDTKTKESKNVSLTKENLPSMKKWTSKSTVISKKKIQAKTMKAKNVSLKMKRLPSKKKLTSKSNAIKQMKISSKSGKSKKISKPPKKSSTLAMKSKTVTKHPK